MSVVKSCWGVEAVSSLPGATGGLAACDVWTWTAAGREGYVSLSCDRTHTNTASVTVRPCIHVSLI